MFTSPWAYYELQLFYLAFNSITVGISVLICSYNGKDRLPSTLKHLSMQRVAPGINWEIILVDNASIDNTSEEARKIWQALQSTVPFKILFQPVTGKTAALQMGYESTQYEYMLVCDDDNWLNADYVQTAYNLIHNDPFIAAVGGKATAVCEQSPPNWFEQFCSCYAVGPQSTNEDATEKKCLYGAGMVMRKEAISKAASLNLQLEISDRKGDGKKKIIGGGDTELCLIFSLLGYRLLYHDALQFRHYIPANRLNLEYLNRLFRGYGVTLPLLSAYEELLRCKRLNKKVDKYFWVNNFLSCCGSMITDLFSWRVSQLLARKNALKKKMDFVFNREVAYNYLRYNSRLSDRVMQLHDKFSR